ncbi:hypothetical protein ACRAWG_32510 [Methylobacterium sp. P31]
MRSCIGDGEYDLYAGDEDIASGIWSLRDRAGLSRLTVQVLLCQIEDAYGLDNHPIGKWAALQIRHLIAAYAAAGRRLMADAYPDLVIAPDGKTYRHDRVPVDVRKAMAAAEREERIVAAAREVIGIGRLMHLMGVYPVAGVGPHATVGQASAPTPEAAPAEPDELVTLEVRDLQRGEIVDLCTPDGQSSFNVTDVQVLGRRGRPMLAHRFTVDALEGIVMFHRNQPMAIIRFRPGPVPASVPLMSMGTAAIKETSLGLAGRALPTSRRSRARAVSDPALDLLEQLGRGDPVVRRPAHEDLPGAVARLRAPVRRAVDAHARGEPWPSEDALRAAIRDR